MSFRQLVWISILNLTKKTQADDPVWIVCLLPTFLTFYRNAFLLCYKIITSLAELMRKQKWHDWLNAMLYLTWFNLERYSGYDNICICWHDWTKLSFISGFFFVFCFFIRHFRCVLGFGVFKLMTKVHVQKKVACLCNLL